jgi:hypothetical protein
MFTVLRQTEERAETERPIGFLLFLKKSLRKKEKRAHIRQKRLTEPSKRVLL